MIKVEIVESCKTFISCIKPDTVVNSIGTMLAALIGAGIAALIAWRVSEKALKSSHLDNIENLRYIIKKNKSLFSKMEHHYNQFLLVGVSDEFKKNEAKEVKLVTEKLLGELDIKIAPSKYLTEFESFRLIIRELGSAYTFEKYKTGNKKEFLKVGDYKIMTPEVAFEMYNATKKRLFENIDI